MLALESMSWPSDEEALDLMLALLSNFAEPENPSPPVGERARPLLVLLLLALVIVDPVRHAAPGRFERGDAMRKRVDG